MSRSTGNQEGETKLLDSFVHLYGAVLSDVLSKGITVKSEVSGKVVMMIYHHIGHCNAISNTKGWHPGALDRYDWYGEFLQNVLAAASYVQSHEGACSWMSCVANIAVPANMKRRKGLGSSLELKEAFLRVVKYTRTRRDATGFLLSISAEPQNRPLWSCGEVLNVLADRARGLWIAVDTLTNTTRYTKVLIQAFNCFVQEPTMIPLMCTPEFFTACIYAQALLNKCKGEEPKLLMWWQLVRNRVPFAQVSTPANQNAPAAAATTTATTGAAGSGQKNNSSCSLQ